MKLGIIRLYAGESGKVGYYNIQELGLAKALAKKGINTDIFFLVNKKEIKEVKINEISDKIRVIYIPSFKMANHGIISPRFIIDYDIDVVHLLSDNQVMVPSFIKFCKKNNIPLYNYVGTISSDTNNTVKKKVMDILAKRNIKYFTKSNVVVKTPAVKQELESYNVNNIRIISVGLDLDIIPKVDSTRLELRKELNLPIDKKILLFVGRLEEYKEPIKAIELINYFKNISNDYILVIIGQGSLKEKIKMLIRENNLCESLILIDKIENREIHKYYKASDIFINFNRKEIFGMSILESMNQGCKVIAVDAPGPNYIINDKVNGVIINDYKMENWATAINENINNVEMSQLAKCRIKSDFNWDSIANEYLVLFDEIKGE